MLCATGVILGISLGIVWERFFKKSKPIKRNLYNWEDWE